MKRYTSVPNQNLRNLIVRYLEMEDAVIEDPNGDWVKYVDYFTNFKDVVEHYQRKIDRLHGLSQCPTKPECNCYEHRKVGMGKSCLSISWVCPAHGLKGGKQ